MPSAGLAAVPGRLKVVTYANARHGFDLQSPPERTPYEHGGSLGYNLEAHRAAKTEIAAFLK